jgi:hypothetical protein
LYTLPVAVIFFQLLAEGLQSLKQTISRPTLAKNYFLTRENKMDATAVSKQIPDEDEPKKKGLALLAHDFRQKQLIPIKILSFLILASIKLS